MRKTLSADHKRVYNSINSIDKSIDNDDDDDDDDDDAILKGGKAIIDINNNSSTTTKMNTKPSLSRFYSNPHLLSLSTVQKDEVPLADPHIHYGHHNTTRPTAGSSSSSSSSSTTNNYPTNVKDAYIDTIKTHFFYLGLSSGSALQMFLVSFIIMIVSTLSNAGPIRELSHEYYSVFRGVFLISFFFTLWGALIFVWRRAKVDYVNVLNVSYAHTYQYILRVSTTIAYIIFTSFMLYILTITGAFDSIAQRSVLKHFWPLASLLVPLSLLLNPFDTITFPCFGVKRNGFKQRWGLIKEIVQIIMSPFSKITMLRILIADCICSMPLVLPDIQYTICLYITGSFKEKEEDWDLHPPIPHAYYTCGKGNRVYFIIQLFLAFLPFWIRTLQCFRQFYDSNYTNYNTLFNALKYFISMSLTALSAANSAHPTPLLQTLWITNGIIATCYSYYWDVCMDWGLGHFSSRNVLLRDNITFSPAVYYTAIVLDFIFRLGWSFVISPSQPYLRQHFILMLGAIEIIRRCIWAIIRVEYEHTKNIINQHNHQNAQRDSKMNKISRNDLYNNNIDFTMTNNSASIFQVRDIHHHNDDDNDSDYNHRLTYNKHTTSFGLHHHDVGESNEF